MQCVIIWLRFDTDSKSNALRMFHLGIPVKSNFTSTCKCLEIYPKRDLMNIMYTFNNND